MDARIKKEAPIFNGIDKMPIGKLKSVKEYRERIKPQDYKSSTAGIDAERVTNAHERLSLFFAH